jgi:hypothetical protein
MIQSLNRQFLRLPHLHIASITGLRLAPAAVSEYSTFGGTSA